MTGSAIKTCNGKTGVHAVFEPARSWEKDERPPLGSPASCAMHHTGYCMSGKLVARMVEAGLESRITARDLQKPRRHDAYVDGAERVGLILFAPPEHGL